MARKRKDTDNHPIVDLYRKGLAAQRRLTSNFWVNTAFLRGDQWVYIHGTTGQLREVPEPEDRVRATINRLWPGSRTIISKLIQRQLVFEVTPNSADDVAIEGAKVGEAILHAVSTEHQWERLRESAAWSMWKGGVSALAVDWNPARGKPTALADDGRKMPSGDTEEAALSPAEFVIEPGAPNAETANWWIKVQALPPKRVQNAYEMGDEPDADASAGLSSLGQRLLASHVGGTNGPGGPDNSTPLTLVLTYYERPNPANEKGKVEVVVNGHTVWGPKEWPFPFVDYLNIVTGVETMIENTWMGETVVTSARPIQAAFNAAWSNILEHSDIAGNARMLTPVSSVELTSQYSDTIGESLVYADAGDKPGWLEPPQLPQWLLNIPLNLREELDDTIGVHDVSRGDAPVNIESGYGLAVLAEQDATPIGKMATSMATMFSRLASMVLKIYEAEVKETRTAVIEMPGESATTVDWSGESLAGQTEATVPLELVMPRSRTAMAQFAEKMMQMGLIETIEDLARLAEVPGERYMVEAVRPAVARARRENAGMARGVVRLPEDFDDHAIHIKEHNAFRQSARYEGLDAATKHIFAAHIQGHSTLAAEEAAKAQMMATGGGPALASVPRGDGSEAVPVTLPGELPPPAEQTVSDQLSGDIEMALEREQAAASSEGAAVTQQELERDEILAIMNAAQGGAVL